MQRIEELENEIETLKSANKKLSREIDSYKQCSSMSGSLNALDEINHYNIYNKNGGSNVDISETNKLKSKLNDYESKMKKLQEDNFGFKSEIDKLYDDIGKFEKEIRVLRDENLHLKDDNENLLDEIDWIKSTKIPQTGVNGTEGGDNQLKVENDRLKQEIDALNNELDELIYYKSNFERLNLDYEKLKQKSVENLLTSAASSTLTLNKHGGSQSHLVGAGTSGSENKNLHLEIEWIRRENEKLLLENENLQTKVGEQKISIEKLHKDMHVKDERMNKFIEQVEKNKLENNQEETIKLQKEITKLESALNDEKRSYNYIKDQNETKQKELNDMNEHLWNNFNKIQHNYDEAIEIIKSKETDIENLLNEKSTLEKSIKLNEQTINQNENKINDILNELNIKENKIRILEFEINKNKVDLNLLSEEKVNEKTTFELNINDLKQLNKNLQSNLNSKDTEISSLIKDKELLIVRIY
jgi:chromosome segregation ATPase